MSVRVIEGDCLQVLPTLREQFDAVLADPPYGVSNNTNSKRFSGGSRALRPVDGRDDWPEVRGDSAPFDPSPWLAFPKVVLWGWNHFAQRTPPGTTLIWLKKGDHLFGTFLSDAEVAWMKGGSGVYCFRKQFPPPSRIEEAEGECAHPNQKPIALMRWCLARLKLEPGMTVLDPYCGSGTVGVACVQMGLNYVGIELDPVYAATARRRIAAAIGPLFAEATA